jgi:hypothetical protein
LTPASSATGSADVWENGWENGLTGEGQDGIDDR